MLLFISIFLLVSEFGNVLYDHTHAHWLVRDGSVRLRLVFGDEFNPSLSHSVPAGRHSPSSIHIYDHVEICHTDSTHTHAHKHTRDRILKTDL